MVGSLNHGTFSAGVLKEKTPRVRTKRRRLLDKVRNDSLSGPGDSANDQEETAKTTAYKGSISNKSAGQREDLEVASSDPPNPFIDSNSSDHTYYPSEDSESTDSEYNDSIKYKVDWFVGPGDEETLLTASGLSIISTCLACFLSIDDRLSRRHLVA
ncbi:hypothetical protein BC938DRAFT_470802 [Jimgerdemannia flammicorona]|uniref:Uncharacterized protein n=1 Tax=Jimgerdemannia flammicorona TaxID=994334 RepID=A0A433Q9E7_9FUNG|nr:hypothetical protein BC938DRAFT_470802 [Jimgerdemannia flammicorona]